MLKVQREFLVILDCWGKIWFCIIFLAKLVLKVHLHMQVQNDMLYYYITYMHDIDMQAYT